VLSLWGIPDTLVSLSAGTVTPGEPKPLQRLERIVALAKATAQHLRLKEGAERDALIAEVRKQCVAEGGIAGRRSTAG
jgi:hypothetical protein